jgi:hypothetical protein
MAHQDEEPEEEEELLESTIDNDDDWADEGWEDVDEEFTFSELCNLDE